MKQKFSRRTILLAAILALVAIWILGFNNANPPALPQPTIAVATVPATSRLLVPASNAVSRAMAGPVLPNVSLISPILSAGTTVPAAPPNGDGQISESALKQIDALLAEKSRRTPVQAKINSQLLYAEKIRRGEPIAAGVGPQRVDLERDAAGRIRVDIEAEVTPSLLQRIVELGGSVINNFPEYRAIQALVPLPEMERLAANREVVFVQPAVRAIHESVTSEGDVTHQASVARTSFGVNGSGVNVGVISDSVDYLKGSQIDGKVTVLAGQSGLNQGNFGEGTAILEIINNLAPGAKLYFASDQSSPAQFAANIRSLRFNYHCDIIVDDIKFYDESPFQDGPIAQAVNAVTADGALYFAAAGNAGNVSSDTSGTWEGDFQDGGTTPIEAGRIHSFGGAGNYNTMLSGGSSQRADLFWADPLGAATNDYDLFVLTNNNVVASSINTQSGSQNPYESISPVFPGEKIVIVKFRGAGRFLHLDTGRGRLTVTTTGNTRGHNSTTNAFSVAATDAYTSYPNAFSGGWFNPVEEYSSDGPRRVFFQANGTPITPGNFSSSGGAVRQKPDLTAADDVMTDVPGFQPFAGTSAAAPHAAAIAALVKSLNPSLTPAQIRSVLTNAVLDIMAAGTDRDSGAGILMAPPALTLAKPFSDLTKFSDSVSDSSPHLGDTVTVTLMVTNRPNATGTGNAGAFHIGFYWSANANFAGATPSYEKFVSGLAGGAAVKLTQTVTIGATNLPGTYYLGYVIDDQNEVTEQNENNNGIYYFTINALAEIQPPTSSIVSPKPGQLWSNNVFTVTGKAADNVAVSNVFCSVNSGGWIAATNVNNWSNWTAQVTLVPGTNALASYAVDTSGNVSLISTVKCVYVVSAMLTVQTNGLGSITPNYNGALLPVGKSFSLTAKPAKGFAFANWTDGPGSMLTNAPTLKFLMASNLTFTANFTDVTKPTLSITNLKAGLRISNDVFTVRGKATDNIAVTNVFYALNGAGWFPATTSNAGSNWAAQVALVPGTNVFSAFAVDGAGNRSLTNTVKFLYVLTDVLAVQTNGRGTIAPNYNGARLQIGVNYSMAAKPATGFAFQNWTDGDGNIVTNGAALKFLMASNLTFVANFRDATPPTLAITNPVAGTHASNSLFIVQGRAADNVAVSNVFYSLNNGSWLPASTASGWTNWFASPTILSGTNALRAFAVDTTGNHSLTNTVNFLSLTVDAAPGSLVGRLANITPAGGDPFTIGFGTNGFSQNSADTNGDNGMGDYFYTKLGTNTARLVINYTAPPTITNDSTSVLLTFSDPTNGTFENELNGLVHGDVTLLTATNWAPLTLVGRRVAGLDAATNVFTLTYATSTYTQTNGSVAVDAGTYFYRAYRPVGGLIVMAGTNGTNIMTLHFTGTNAGNYFSTFYPQADQPSAASSGTFTLPAN
jgi:hypothetical protein